MERKMKNIKLKFLVFAIINLLVLSGCETFIVDRIQNGLAKQETNHIVQAQAISINNNQSVSGGKLLSEMDLGLARNESGSPNYSTTPTPTPTSTVVYVQVSVSTNCRSGPGKSYNKISILGVNKKVEVVGRNAEGTYWIVKNPGGSGTCWLWDEYAIITGQTSNLPIWTAPATPTPQTTATTGVTLSVSVATNCRVGPGKAYDRVSILYTNKIAKVVARNAESTYWVIENPTGSGTCWVWGYYATVSGPKDKLPIYTPPLTPTPQITGVTLEVRVPTNCRVGPGKAYNKISVLNTGKIARVVARNADSTYWVIENPAGSGTCWVWGYYASVTGPKESLPVHTPQPPQPTPTPQTTGVTLTVSVATNCRVGPGKAYDRVSILYTNKTAKVVARNADSTYWVIENPSGSGTCWLWGYYATVSGPKDKVPVYTPPPTPTPTPTPAPTKVTLDVSVDTNCRSGPGKKYNIITILRIGTTAEVVGRNLDQTYWVIKNPSGSGNCWVWGYYADVTGSITNVPILDNPPTPTPTKTP
jgi:uncharacterized protein YgiM (DUF1202 family)